MRTSLSSHALAVACTMFVAFACPLWARAAIVWEAFNDYRPTAGITSPNATGYDLRITGDGGGLKDIATGQELNVSLEVLVLEADLDEFIIYSDVQADSPADKLFKGKVDIRNNGLPVIRGPLGQSRVRNVLVLSFRRLDPGKRYNFRGMVSGIGDNKGRWTTFTLTGADAFVAAHVNGSKNTNIFTRATFPRSWLYDENQVVLNTADNKAGSLVGWDSIAPGLDGSFSIEAMHYGGPAPYGDPINTPYGYGLNAIYLAETLPEEPKITKISLQARKVVLEWTGTTLQSSDDLKTWKDETGAVSPLSVTPTQAKFYRVKN